MRASVERIMASGLARFACTPWMKRSNICSLGVYDGPPSVMEDVCFRVSIMPSRYIGGDWSARCYIARCGSRRGTD